MTQQMIFQQRGFTEAYFLSRLLKGFQIAEVQPPVQWGVSRCHYRCNHPFVRVAVQLRRSI